MNVPATTRAAYVERLGGPDLIRVGELPTPHPGPGEVLVRVVASAVNHVDLLVRSGEYHTSTPFPFVIGRDAVGTVLDPNGQGEFAVGAQVWTSSLGHAGRQGSFAQYVTVPHDRLYPLPEGVDPLRAAAVLHTACTAALGLFHHASLAPGHTVLIAGGAGGVGSAAVQFAAHAGARVIATCAPGDRERCEASGAAQVIDYADPEALRRIGEIAPAGVDLWWLSEHEDLAVTLPLMRAGGTVLVTAGLSASAGFTAGDLYTRDLTIAGFAISNASVADLAAAATIVNDGLAEGVLVPRIDSVVPLAEAAAAHRRMAAGGLRGRLVVTP